MRRPARLPLLALAALVGCAAAAAGGATPDAATARAASSQDTSGLVPAGYGTLRQEDVAVRTTLVGGANVQLLPLDESVIRLLSPDSYRSLRNRRESARPTLDSIARRFGLQRYSVWTVTYFGVEQGEARFSPYEVIVTNAGRDFRPLQLVPLTPGFGEQRLRQREQQAALYVFDGALDVNQPLDVTVETTRLSTWTTDVLPRIERERALVRSRAQRGTSR